MIFLIHTELRCTVNHTSDSIFNLSNQYDVARMQTKFCRCCPNHIKDRAGLLRRVNKQYANIGKPGPSQSRNISSCFLLVSAAWPPLGARLPMLSTLPDLFNVHHQLARTVRHCLYSFRPKTVGYDCCHMWTFRHIEILVSDVRMAAGKTERISRPKRGVRWQTSCL